MNATKLTIIVLSAAAIMFGGCSNNSGILNPGTDFQSDAGTITTNRVDNGSNDAKPMHEIQVITAKVERIDIENGCFYLQVDDGKTYTPFGLKELELETGLKLKAEGYVDYSIEYFCGNGPAFVIESYEILDKPDMRDSNEDQPGVITDNGPTDVSSPEQSPEDRDMMNTPNNSESIIKKKLEEERSGKGQDTDRPGNVTDNGSSDNQLNNDALSGLNSPQSSPDDSYIMQQSGDRAQEAKKKEEEERNRKEQSTDRP